MRLSCIARAFAAVSLSVATSAFAFGALTIAHVTQVRVDANGTGIIFFDQPLVGVATCANAYYNNALAYNATTGKGALALALSAKATGSPIEVYGTGSCGVYPNTVEDFSYGVVK